jgi:hypothetical protein
MSPYKIVRLSPRRQKIEMTRALNNITRCAQALSDGDAARFETIAQGGLSGYMQTVVRAMRRRYPNDKTYLVRITADTDYPASRMICSASLRRVL